MRQLFYGILSLSVSGALTGLALLLLRPFTERFFSKRWNYYIWLLVIARLLWPVSLSPGVEWRFPVRFAQEEWGAGGAELKSVENGAVPAAAPEGEAIPPDPAMPPREGEETGPVQTEGTEGFTIRSEALGWAGPVPAQVAGILWLMGAGLFLAVKMVNYRRFNRRIRRESREITDGEVLARAQELCRRLSLKKMPVLWESPSVSGPITIGLARPVVVLPVQEEEPDRQRLILHHELIHIKRRDLWYKWLFQILLCIHWFNPVLYLAGRALNRDCELSCDEEVLGILTPVGKRAYGNLLISAAERNMGMRENMLSTTLLERKEDLKERLRGILHYRRRGRGRAAVSLCIALVMMMLSACGSVQMAPDTVSARISDESGRDKEAEASREESASGSSWNDFWGDFFGEIFDYDVDDFLKSHPVVNKSGNAWRVYDDDELLAGKDVSGQRSAFIYSGGSQGVTCSGLFLNGSETILIEKAQEEMQLQVDTAFELVEGRFKIIYVSPEGEVETLNETGESASRTITLKEGRNVIRMVGQGGRLRALEVRFDRPRGGDGKNVYTSEAEEYGDLVLEEIRRGEVDKAALFHAIPYMEEEKTGQVLQALLEKEVALSGEEICDLLIYSDVRQSGRYLVQAVRDGRYTFEDENAIADVIIYLDEREAQELLLALMDRGDTLTFSGFSKIAPYLSEETIRRLDEWPGQK